MSKGVRRGCFQALVLSDGDSGLGPVQAALARRGAAVHEAAGLAEAVGVLETVPIDVVLLGCAAGRAEQAARAMLDAKPSLRLLACGPSDNARVAMAMIRLGAVDYLVEPINQGRLAEALDLLEVDLAVAEGPADAWSDDEVLFNGNPPLVLVGASPEMVRVRKVVRTLAGSDATVLVHGETGTGKEVVAQAVHRARHGMNGPFVAVNCAQISGELIESQLFGHVKGAFTGAVADSQGFFRAAEGGTLFLDEISEMSPALQAKLLRAIQEREIIPVGSTEPKPVDVNIVAATNRDPLRAVADGTLRQDLYYRLSQVNIYLSPLRERPGDLPGLIRYFVGLHAKRCGTRPKRIEPRVKEFLAQHDWPGNVRELESVIHRIHTFEKSHHGLLVANLLPHVPPGENGAARGPGAGGTLTEADIVPLDDLERGAISQALAVTGGNRTKAASLLGIERHRLTRRIRVHGIECPDGGRQSAPVGALCASGA